MKATQQGEDDTLAAVVVLYGTAPFDSEALTSLAAVSLDPQSPEVRVMIWDNSPVAHIRMPEGLPLAILKRDPSNPGLARAYNEALQWAKREGHRWLLLLDQDTTVTGAYLRAVADFTAAHQRVPEDLPSIGVGFPSLAQNGKVLSPTYFPRLRARPYPGRRPKTKRLMVLNSGTVVSVEAAISVGGFPIRYPLDALDHAFVSELRLADFRSVAIPVALEHHASTSAMQDMTPERLKSLTKAEVQYFTEYGSRADRTWLLLRRVTRVLQVILGRRNSPSLRIEVAALGSAFRSLVIGGRGR